MPPNPSCLTNDLSLLSSETIEVVAQFGQKQFFVHKNILVAQSESLSRTVGVSSGADGKKIDLSSWDGDTVGRFLQFLYVGSYQVPDSTVDGEYATEDDKEEERQDGVMTPDTVQSLVGRGGWEFEELGGGVNVLLVHAKVYALAQSQGVQALKVMALQRLEIMLGEIEVDTLKETARGFIGLLEYAYSHTSPEEPLRDFVSAFAANNFEKLMGQREMGFLLREGGDCVVELMEKIAGRLEGIDNKFLETREGPGVAEKESQVSQGVARLRVGGGGNKVLPLSSGNWFLKFQTYNMPGAQVASQALDELVRIVVSVGKWVFSPYGLLRTLTFSVMAITIALFIWKTLRQHKTIGPKSFEEFCQYYEMHSWAGSTIVTVGKKPLKVACDEYILGSWVQKPLRTAQGTMKDMCHFYEANLWAGSNVYSVGGRTLKDACINDYLIERPSFEGRPITEMCQYYEGNSWVGSNVYGVNGKSLRKHCDDEGYTKEPYNKIIGVKKSVGTVFGMKGLGTVKPFSPLNSSFFLFFIFPFLLALLFWGMKNLLNKLLT